MFLVKGVSKICSKFTGQHSCRSMISIYKATWFKNKIQFGKYLFLRAPLGGNDSRVCRSNKGLMPAFKVFTYMLDIVILPHFFHLKKNMLPENLNKICVHILALLLTFPIFVLLTSSNLTSGGISSDFMWEERKFNKTLNPSRIYGIIFWSAFLNRLYFKHSFANNHFLE